MSNNRNKNKRRKAAAKKTPAKATTPKAELQKGGVAEFREDDRGIELSEAYVMRGSQTIDSAADRRLAKLNNMKSASPAAVLAKNMTGSNQKDAQDATKEITFEDIIAPPYEPSVLAKYIDVDHVHFRCVATKVIDTLGGKAELTTITEDIDVDDKDYQKQKKEVFDFITSANDIDGFQGALEKGDMDLESIGWAAFEIVRSMDKKIRYFYHIPASRIRVLRGHRGFVESYYTTYGSDVEANPYVGDQDEIYYLPFGEKVLSRNRKKIDGTPERYDPNKDGDISNGEWNTKSRYNLTENAPLAKSANEIMFVKKPHPKSIYYGIPDFIPAIAAIRGNLNIRDFFFQYFEHNAVPQYAVIIKGAHLKDDVKEMIQDYFSTHIKGQAHSTLVIPIPASAGGDVSVTFERLSSEVKEGSFQETKKNNQYDIIVSHGMSPAIIGMVESASLGSGKGTAQTSVYKNRVVIPRQQKWQRVLNNLFKLGLGVTKVGIEFEELDIDDKRELKDILIAYMQDGALNRNEVRKKAKLGPPIEGGERYSVIRGGIPIYVDEMDPKKQEAIEAKRMKLLGTKGEPTSAANKVDVQVEKSVTKNVKGEKPSPKKSVANTKADAK